MVSASKRRNVRQSMFSWGVKGKKLRVTEGLAEKKWEKKVVLGTGHEKRSLNSPLIGAITGLLQFGGHVL